MQHLTLRVAWHDNRWNGTIRRAPSRNSFCVALDRIREDRNDAREDRLAGRPWQELGEDNLPPCIAESGGFMSDREWVRVFAHLYQRIKQVASTHGHLRPTPIRVPAYATFGTSVPIRVGR